MNERNILASLLAPAAQPMGGQNMLSRLLLDAPSPGADMPPTPGYAEARNPQPTRPGWREIVAETLDPNSRGNRIVMGFAANPATFGGPNGIPLYKSPRISAEMNARLRDGLPLRPEELRAAEELERLMAPVSSNMTLWRGVRDGPYARASVGDMIADPAFMSTAATREQAQVFASGAAEPAIIGFRVPRGTTLADLTQYGEQEFVLPRGMPWRVEEVIRRPDIIRQPIVRMALPPR